jgi:hypothetical protein
MKRPAFQFYPNDWRGNANLRRCTEAARGAWIDVLCLLHDSDEYGVLRWPLADIAQASGLPLKLLQELSRKGVLKGGDSNVPDYCWAPSHAGKAGDPVTLVAGSAGPCWYCSRFVRDEYVRQRRGAGTRFDTNNQPPNPKPKGAPMPPIGGRQGDGASSSSSSSIKQEPVPTVLEASPPADPIWETGLAFLIRKGIAEKQARPLLGKVKKAAGDIEAARILADAESQDITDPAPWLMAAAANARSHVTGGRHSAAADFRGKSYESTPDDELPESLR